jgi:hypothetical protein
MRVNLLSYEPAGGWILYDYAVKLAAALKPHASAATVGFGQAPGFDVTFHVNYAGLRQIQVPGLHCTMVTHIDTPEKFNLVRTQAAAGVLGFCMSEETARRLNTLTGYTRFFNFAPPAMISAPPRTLAMMIAGRLYDDGRKNERWAIDFFKCFRPADLVIRVMGSGWGPVLEPLRRQGYAVEQTDDYQPELYHSWLKASDHLLITGNDEGALSALDALVHGVVPIVTAQGYHLEQEGEVLLYATHEQLMRLAAKLRARLDEANEARHRLTDWNGFAIRHADHWAAQIAAMKAAA